MRLLCTQIVLATVLFTSSALAAPSIKCQVKFEGEAAVHSNGLLNSDGCVLVTVESLLDSNKTFWGGACRNLVALSFTSGSKATALARGENRAILEIPGKGAGTCEITDQQADLNKKED